MEEMMEVRNNFEVLREEVSKTMNIKIKYAEEIRELKSKIQILERDLNVNRENLNQFEEVSEAKRHEQLAKRELRTVKEEFETISLSLREVEEELKNERIEK